MLGSLVRSLRTPKPKPAHDLPVLAVSDGLARQFGTWGAGLNSEIAFWGDWFRTRGGEWPEDFVLRQDGTREIKPELVDGLASTGGTLSVLDVGAGPMTKLGPMREGKPYRLVAVDPLAPFYDALAERNGVRRPVVTRQGFAEDLTAAFDPGSFDLVYCSNALDHSFDPIRGIEEMLAVARVGGRVVLEHYLNEASHGEWDGLHQWNFDAEDGRFVVWNRERRVDVSRMFEKTNLISVAKDEGRRTIRVAFERTGAMSVEPGARARARVTELLGAAVLAFQGNSARA